MLGIDTRAARATWTVFVIALLIFVVWLARSSILTFVVALFFAYMLSPVVDLICRYSPKRVSRTLSIALVYLVLVASLVILSAWLGSRLVEEATSFVKGVPELIKKHRSLGDLPVPSWLEPYWARLSEMIRSQLDTGAERILPVLQSTLGGVASVLGSLGFVVLVPVLGFLFLKDAAQIRESFLNWVAPGDNRLFVDDVLSDIHVLLGSYIRALVILSAVTSVAYLIFFESIGLPYAVLLSFLAAPLEFVPFIGPILGTVLILVVAMFTGFPHILWIVIFFVAYRLFQDYLLQPYLLSSGVELHPLIVIFGALAGNEIGGLWGMFLSLPLLASLRVILVNARKQRLREKKGPIAVVSPGSS